KSCDRSRGRIEARCGRLPRKALRPTRTTRACGGAAAPGDQGKPDACRKVQLWRSAGRFREKRSYSRWQLGEPCRQRAPIAPVSHRPSWNGPHAGEHSVVSVGISAECVDAYRRCTYRVAAAKARGKPPVPKIHSHSARNGLPLLSLIFAPDSQVLLTFR